MLRPSGARPVGARGRLESNRRGFFRGAFRSQMVGRRREIERRRATRPEVRARLPRAQIDPRRPLRQAEQLQRPGSRRRARTVAIPPLQRRRAGSHVRPRGLERRRSHGRATGERRATSDGRGDGPDGARWSAGRRGGHRGARLLLPPDNGGGGGGDVRAQREPRSHPARRAGGERRAWNRRVTRVHRAQVPRRRRGSVRD
mmetsp:Transcript_7813/g.34451  ORF Transcript_7813/g.34451 Transcript_7813/m.34451 type:complete len:201 (-) Transcript_7813:1019-1621(-)